MKSNYKKLNGYIEGFYGRLLNWKDRNRIVLNMKRNKMNFYFYAPKEDDKHRLFWKLKYERDWIQNFKKFINNARKNNVSVIVGISPGISFDFKDFQNKIKQNKKSLDLNILLNKINFFLENGANEIGLLFDDLPNNFKNIYGNNASEGYVHALLANNLSYLLNKSIYVVPRIYADQLKFEDKNYIVDYGKYIHKDNITFYCGKNIVSKNINKSTISNISKAIPTKLVIWDNFYSNDYCPRKLFLGPYINRYQIDDIMINPTGLIETDLLILDIVKSTKNSLRPKSDWEKTLQKHNVPLCFLNISNYFLSPDFGEKPKLKKIIPTSKNITTLDFLLWKWKTPLSREWFPFLFGLKHDILLLMNDFTTERIIKTQTKALAKYLINN